MTQPTKPMILKGGRVLDPGGGLDAQLDIKIRNDRIEEVAPDIPVDGANVRNVSGLLVLPGLVDPHLHLVNGLGTMGADPDVFGVGSGVTTVVDAGSTGHSLFPVFHRYIAAPAKSRVLAYINLSTLGSVVGPWYGNLSDPRLIDEEKITQVVEAHGETIVGIKVMATGTTLGSQGLEPLKRARRLADGLRLPLLIHIGESWGQAHPVALAEILKDLRPRDAITHMFTGHPGGLLDANGKLWPQVRGARDEGILFDVGHGLNNLSFDVAHRVLDQGFEPDTVSTDGHRLNREGPVYDLPTTMSKLMALGFSLPQVVEMATRRAARLLGQPHLGTLAVGSQADVSVLRLEEREWTAADSRGGKVPGSQILVPVFCIRKGIAHEAPPAKRP